MRKSFRVLGYIWLMLEICFSSVPAFSANPPSNHAISPTTGLSVFPCPHITFEPYTPKIESSYSGDSILTYLLAYWGVLGLVMLLNYLKPDYRAIIARLKPVFLGFNIWLGILGVSRLDQYFEWNLIDRDLFIVVNIVFFVVVGLLLLGNISFRQLEKTAGTPIPRFVLSMLCFCIAMYLTPGLWGGPLTAIQSLLPQSHHFSGVNVLGGRTTRPNLCPEGKTTWSENFIDYQEGNCWFNDYCEAADYAQKTQKPLFVYFNSHHFSTRKIEGTIFSRADVQQFFTQDYVLLSLWTSDHTRLPEPYSANKAGEKLKTIGDVALSFEEEVIFQNSQPIFCIIKVQADKAQIIVPPIGFDDAIVPRNFVRFLKLGFETYHSE